MSVSLDTRSVAPRHRPGGAWWGLPSGRSREPHIALESRKGTGYGRENVTVSHAPPGTITKRCRCRGAGTPGRSGDTNPRASGGRGRRRQRIEHLGSDTCRSPFRRVAVSRARRTDRTLSPVAPEPRIEQQIEHQIEQGDRTPAARRAADRHPGHRRADRTFPPDRTFPARSNTCRSRRRGSTPLAAARGGPRPSRRCRRAPGRATQPKSAISSKSNENKDLSSKNTWSQSKDTCRRHMVRRKTHA